MLNFCDAASVVSIILLYASSVAPALSFIAIRVSLYASLPAFASDNAPVPASTELHNSLNFVRLPFTLFTRTSSTSPIDLPSLESSAKVLPVSSFSALATLLELSPNSLSIDLMYVPASAVAIPFLVSWAYAVDRLSISTLYAAASGIVLPTELANSSTVVLPKFCVVTRMSEIYSV